MIKILRKTSVDFKESMTLVQNTKEEIRLIAEKHFGDIFEQVKSLAKKIDIIRDKRAKNIKWTN